MDRASLMQPIVELDFPLISNSLGKATISLFTHLAPQASLAGRYSWAILSLWPWWRSEVGGRWADYPWPCLGSFLR